jgi:hypothetical protein
MDANKYAILMETSGAEFESWYYFIRYEGNEEALHLLQEQLEKVRWRILGDYSTFDLEIDTLVSDQTAREMINIDLNPTSRHRKFDGVLQVIDLGFLDSDKNSKKIKKAFKVLGYGKISEFIDNEEVIEEDEDAEYSCGSSCDCEDTCSESDDESDSEFDTESETDSEPKKKPKQIVKARPPPVITASERARKLKMS